MEEGVRKSAPVAPADDLSGENLAATIERLQRFADPEQSTQAEWDALDWRALCNRLWRVIAALSAAAPVAPVAPESEDVWTSIDRMAFDVGPCPVIALDDLRRILVPEAIAAFAAPVAPAEPAALPEPVKNGWMDCEDCDGRGAVGEMRYMGEFQPPEREPCSSCNGSGRWKVPLYTEDQMRAALATAVAPAHCPKCEGSGWMRDVHDMEQGRIRCDCQGGSGPSAPAASSAPARDDSAASDRGGLATNTGEAQT
jgi:hypothetical protein